MYTVPLSSTAFPEPLQDCHVTTFAQDSSIVSLEDLLAAHIQAMYSIPFRIVNWSTQVAILALECRLKFLESQDFPLHQHLLVNYCVVFM